MTWAIPLHTKSAALVDTHQFCQMVKMQFQVSVQGWMSDFGGEYKSTTYDDLLKGEGIRVYDSALHVPQQNACAKHIMHTLMDKANAMCHMAWLPNSWQEFTTPLAIHMCNRTPYEALHNKQP